jgi:lysophospholipase L1-like esterase
VVAGRLRFLLTLTLTGKETPMTKTLATLTLALMLAACGGGGGDSTPTPPTQPAAEQPPTQAPDIPEPPPPPEPEPMPPPEPGPEEVCFQTMRVLLNGDSTLWGADAEAPGQRAAVYPESALQALMDQRFGPGVIEVRTGAVPGATSTDALTQPRDADLVVYNPGINDVADGHSRQTYWASMRELAQVPGAVFMTPLPLGYASPSYGGTMEEVARENEVPLIDANAWALAQEDYWRTFAIDRVHLNSAGYAELARWALYPALEPIIAHKLCDRPVYLD